ncbi:MAG: SRPBCC family protein [Actinobacteria bacterium]|nr:SRPBCC family protein [Actinomycetota bacterium]
MRVQASAEFTSEPERVWAAAVRWEDQPRWMQDAVWVRVVSSERAGVGTRIRVKNRVLHVPLFAEELEVTTWEPPTRLEMRHRSFVRGLGTWELEPDDHGARFTWTEDLSLPVPLLGELALLVYRPFLRRLMRRGLSRLQRLVDAT